MATIKVLLWKHDKKKDGTFPLAIRITKDRKTRYVFTGEYIHEKDWDAKSCTVKKGHSNSVRLNNKLAKKVSDAHASILEQELNDEESSVSTLKRKITKKKNGASFYAHADARIQLKHTAKVYSVSRAEQSILNNIKKFHQASDLKFREITPTFLTKFKAFCTGELGQSTRTTTNQLIFIRTLFNIAIKAGDVDEKYYPFAGDKEKIRLTTGNKIGLTEIEIGMIESLELEKDTSIWHTRNIWLFAFYMAGMRISDVLQLKWTDIKDSRLYYVMNKNDKPLSLKLPKKAKSILAYYETSKSEQEFVFPFLKGAHPNKAEEFFVKTRNAARLMNKYLRKIATMCGIEKSLSNHIARHSFGNIAGDKINPYDLKKLYRHSDLKTTIAYQANFIHKNADEALDSVLDF